MCPDNILSSSYYHTREFKNMVANRLYIIDFNSSKQFALGPWRAASDHPSTDPDPAPERFTPLRPLLVGYVLRRTHARVDRGGMSPTFYIYFRQTSYICVL